MRRVFFNSVYCKTSNQARAKQIDPTSLSDIQPDDKGIQGQWNGQRIKIGSTEFLAKEIEKSRGWEELSVRDQSAGHSMVYLAIDGRLAAIFVFGDTVRPESRAMVEKLSALGSGRSNMLNN